MDEGRDFFKPFLKKVMLLSYSILVRSTLILVNGFVYRGILDTEPYPTVMTAALIVEVAALCAVVVIDVRRRIVKFSRALPISGEEPIKLRKQLWSSKRVIFIEILRMVVCVSCIVFHYVVNALRRQEISLLGASVMITFLSLSWHNSITSGSE